MKIKIKDEHHNIISHVLKIQDGNSIKCVALLEYFISEYPDAYGSTPDIGNHQSYKGGYYFHISDILDSAVLLYKTLSKKDKLNFTLSDAVLVLFLHDIEKPVKYGSKDAKSDGEIRNFLIDYETYLQK